MGLPMSDPKHEYLGWLSSGRQTLHIQNDAFTCNVYKVNEFINNVMTPVIALGQLTVSGYDGTKAPYMEFMDFLKFVEQNNPRQVLMLVEVSMNLYHLVGEPDNYQIVDATMNGANSTITIWK